MPRAPRKCPKPGCENRITNTAYCAEHTTYGWSTDSRKRTSSPEHRAQRLRILERDGYRCQLRYPNRCVGTATQMDHKTPVYRGGSDDDSNMQAACRPCHAKKSSDEGNQARRR
ncbi:HNH endonuclease [Nocardia asiatica]|uniref:HNH endonuclease n=1 Tax=Nocardia asiatica TaxID=209252 RepID=UPI0002EBECBC|nr:HNH endonuclease signature motif containing protein [Nocardia asiatica]